MKVTILEPSGYCAGVERAINLALKTKKEHENMNVVVLGMLVHNNDSLKTLEEAGLRTIYKKGSSLEELANEITEPSFVILTAHGHSENLEKILINKGHTIVDTTCPFVSKSIDEIKNQIMKGNEVFYIGVKNHPEANAALSISNKVHLIDANEKIIPEINDNSPFVLTQTTLSEFEVDSLNAEILKKYPRAVISKGVCNASTARQESLLNLDNSVDFIYVVGGKNSNNSKTLYSLAREKYPSIGVKLIENEDEINKKDLSGLSHIVISSGASTPKSVIEKIKTKLLSY